MFVLSRPFSQVLIPGHACEMEATHGREGASLPPAVMGDNPGCTPAARLRTLHQDLIPQACLWKGTWALLHSSSRLRS